MEQFSNNPYQIAARLLEEFRQGGLDAEQFLSKMDLFEDQVRTWYEQLEKIRVGRDLPEEQQLLEDAKDSLALVYEAVELMRTYAGDPKEEVATEALRLAQQGSEVMAELIDITEENLANLENESGGGSILG